MSLTVKTKQFEGPVSLLVQLSRLNEIDMLTVMLSDLCKTLLERSEIKSAENLELVSQTLPVLSQLLELKSRLLLPSDEELIEEIEESATSSNLVHELMQYRRLREAATALAERARKAGVYVPRLVTDTAWVAPIEEQPLVDVELWDLLAAFSRLLKQNIFPVADEIPKDPTPITVYMDLLEQQVQANWQRFDELLSSKSRAQLIGKFLALLELIKAGRVSVTIDQAGELLIGRPSKQTANTEGVGTTTNGAEPPDGVNVPNSIGTGDDDQAVMADQSVPPEFLTSTERAQTVDPDVVDEEELWDEDLPDLDAFGGTEFWQSLEDKPAATNVGWTNYQPLVDDMPPTDSGDAHKTNDASATESASSNSDDPKQTRPANESAEENA